MQGFLSSLHCWKLWAHGHKDIRPPSSWSAPAHAEPWTPVSAPRQRQWPCQYAACSLGRQPPRQRVPRVLHSQSQREQVVGSPLTRPRPCQCVAPAHPPRFAAPAASLACFSAQSRARRQLCSRTARLEPQPFPRQLCVAASVSTSASVGRVCTSALVLAFPRALALEWSWAHSLADHASLPANMHVTSLTRTFLLWTQSRQKKKNPWRRGLGCVSLQIWKKATSPAKQAAMMRPLVSIATCGKSVCSTPWNWLFSHMSAPSHVVKNGEDDQYWEQKQKEELRHTNTSYPPPPPHPQSPRGACWRQDFVVFATGLMTHLKYVATHCWCSQESMIPWTVASRKRNRRTRQYSNSHDLAMFTTAKTPWWNVGPHVAVGTPVLCKWKEDAPVSMANTGSLVNASINALRCIWRQRAHFEDSHCPCGAVVVAGRLLVTWRQSPSSLHYKRNTPTSARVNKTRRATMLALCVPPNYFNNDMCTNMATGETIMNKPASTRTPTLLVTPRSCTFERQGSRTWPVRLSADVKNAWYCDINDISLFEFLSPPLSGCRLFSAERVCRMWTLRKVRQLIGTSLRATKLSHRLFRNRFRWAQLHKYNELLLDLRYTDDHQRWSHDLFEPEARRPPQVDRRHVCAYIAVGANWWFWKNLSWSLTSSVAPLTLCRVLKRVMECLRRPNVARHHKEALTWPSLAHAWRL